MADTVFAIGETATASKQNQNHGLNSNTIAYDASGRVSTVTDDNTGTVWTYTYNADDSVNTVTDGTNTWTYSYNGAGDVTGVIRTP